VQDNILFGRLVYGRSQSQRIVGTLMYNVIEALGLKRIIIELGLGFEVGIAGGRLSASQRARIGIGRTLLKRPDLLIIDGATASLDPASQSAIRENILTECSRSGQVWVLGDEQDVSGFGHVIVMEQGRILDDRILSQRSEPPLLAEAL
jgi:putative ABC transport system ATP-binding protein